MGRGANRAKPRSPPAEFWSAAAATRTYRGDQATLGNAAHDRRPFYRDARPSCTKKARHIW